jgi:selenide,water dikinase
MMFSVGRGMSIKLTQTVQKGGCAAKVAAKELRQILSRLKFPPRAPEVLVDGANFDDAAIYKISEEAALVQTLDFFTPIVDTPYIFGKVAAANAISDVYAMGGSPKTAMAILAFPLATISSEVIGQVLQGACDVMTEAGVSFVGGHSIDDDTLKFGLSVTGLVNPKHSWINSAALAGQVLVLTKALGTGTLAAALKQGEVEEAQISESLDSMAQINNVIDLLSLEDRQQITSSTDITGFGLLGHAYNMALASQVDLHFDVCQIPRFARAEEMLKKGFLTKAHRTNQEYLGEAVRWGDLTAEQKLLMVDPQTSGGLLLTMSSQAAERLLPKIRQKFTQASVIGKVLPLSHSQAQVFCS